MALTAIRTRLIPIRDIMGTIRVIPGSISAPAIIPGTMAIGVADITVVVGTVVVGTGMAGTAMGAITTNK